MNSIDFYNEVINSDICPDNFDEIYTDFQKYQRLSIDTLSAFHQVCEKNGIRYQLMFGALLGAVRDNGQIPWDYDIDEIIPYEEGMKLIDALNKDLPGDYYFYCPETNVDCRHYFMRVTPRGYKSDKLHVDVFYVIGVPEEERKRINFIENVINDFENRYIRLVKVNEYLSIKRRIKLIFKKLSIINMSLKEINNNLEHACGTYDPNETNTSFPLQQVYKTVYWKTDELWDTELYKTDKGTFRISRNYDIILRTIYKDYTVMYPLKSRLSEMLGCYGNIIGNYKLSRMKKVGRYYIEK